jgi:hypothetical protein
VTSLVKASTILTDSKQPATTVWSEVIQARSESASPAYCSRSVALRWALVSRVLHPSLSEAVFIPDSSGWAV